MQCLSSAAVLLKFRQSVSKLYVLSASMFTRIVQIHHVSKDLDHSSLSQRSRSSNLNW